MDISWAIEQLREFAQLTELRQPQVDRTGSIAFIGGDYRYPAGDSAVIIEKAQIVEKVLDRVLPSWRTTVPADQRHRWAQMREASQRAVAELLRREEVEAHLGPGTPQLDTSGLHPWVWDAAATFWAADAWRVAVAQAAVSLTVHTQRKLGRGDVADDALMAEAWSDKPPAPGRPRLRLAGWQSDQTQGSRLRGARLLAQGAYWAIRNPAAHGVDEWTLQDALEALCVLSCVARFVDEAEVVSASA